MLKVIFVDGDKGGVGKSLVAKTIADMYLWGQEATGLPETHVVVIDADRANPDICGTGGFQPGGRLAGTYLASLEREDDWADFANMMEPYIEAGRSQEVRVIVSMPAQIGPRAFDGSIALVNEIMREVNAVPVWVLSRTRDSIDALAFRLRHMPARYETGMVIKNLFWGASDKFGLWAESALRHTLIDSGQWVETEFPELSDVLMARIARTPFHTVLEHGTPAGRLGLGHRLSLETWRRTAWESLAAVELVGPEVDMAGARS